MKRGAENSNWRGGRRMHPLYTIWHNMIDRCTRPKNTSWDLYGGRGIDVCLRWRNDFWAFVADMGERPEGTTLDRIDNDGNYEPGNCRWATSAEQLGNRRPYKKATHCERGHVFDDANTRIRANGRRACRTCAREYQRTHYQRASA